MEVRARADALARQAGDKLEETADEVESRLFVGRVEELRAMEVALGEGRPAGSVVYVHGPAGVGKSALLRFFTRRCQADGRTVVSLDGNRVRPQLAAVCAAAARALAPVGALTDPVDPSPDGITYTLHALTQRGARVVLVIDAYDRLLPCDRELREHVLSRLDRRVAVCLAGRLPPERLWFGDPAWRGKVREVAVRGFTRDEAAEYLFRVSGRPVSLDPAALHWTDGRPRWLAMLADARAAGRRPNPLPELSPAARAPRPAWQPFQVLEPMLHPGSRRLLWRPGVGASGLDKAVAVASLMRTFTREDLAAVTGVRLANDEWDRLVDLPFVETAGGRYSLNGPVRAAIARLVERDRPWATDAWRRRAAARRLAQAEEGWPEPETAARLSWADLSLLATWTPWHARLHPAAEEAEGWQVGWGIGAQEHAAVVACARAACADLAQPVHRIAADGPHRFLVLRQGAGVRGFAVAVADRDALGVLLVAYPPSEDACGVLLRELCGWFAGYRRVAVGAPGGDPPGEGPAALLGLLGFQPGSGLLPQALGPRTLRCGPEWGLDLEAGGYAGWLRRVVAPAPDVPVPQAYGAAAKEALEAIDAPGKLARTFAARHHEARFGRRGTDRVRQWVLDALREAHLGSASEIRRALLTLYYVERYGSHEAVAERLHQSRPTYFRHHRDALERFGRELFGFDLPS